MEITDAVQLNDDVTVSLIPVFSEENNLEKRIQERLDNSPLTQILMQHGIYATN